MEYEVGKWYGWNGGACPVHPETLVSFATERYGSREYGNKTKAGELLWNSGIIAFRVMTPYDEPKKAREVWMRQVARLKPSQSLNRMEISESFWAECEPDVYGATLFREVLE